MVKVLTDNGSSILHLQFKDSMYTRPVLPCIQIVICSPPCFGNVITGHKCQLFIFYQSPTVDNKFSKRVPFFVVTQYQTQANVIVDVCELFTTFIFA